ncbi:hypothetical protein [Methylacidimicrobium sp. B4]|uniref:hypothetical protein n=1 Tax=Methylacidimicrobium sp. B4 TaxID=2796139 RepID=UPI001A8E067A|nr:hypothetical protein [Methylacidimicrobium sp. B4]QSR84879.1 hypothetical protein MacB4_00960 [Methylacidimicrobium sp. B4]
MPEWVKILQAAQIGMGWTDEGLAERSDTSLRKLQELKAGHLEPAALRSVARVLQLGADALLALAREGSRTPVFPTPRTLRSIETESGRGYLLWDSPSRLASLLDIGETSRPAVHVLESEFLVPRYLFFTEWHRPADPAWIRFLEERGALPLRTEEEAADATFSLGTLQVDRRLVAAQGGAGHLLYVVRGMEVPLAFIGRLLLPPTRAALEENARIYATWLDEVRSHLFTLSDETLLCPSSGPMTSVGFEKAHNPFFPEFEHFSPFASLTEENRNP